MCNICSHHIYYLTKSKCSICLISVFLPKCNICHASDQCVVSVYFKVYMWPMCNICSHHINYLTKSKCSICSISFFYQSVISVMLRCCFVIFNMCQIFTFIIEYLMEAPYKDIFLAFTASLLTNGQWPFIFKSES